MSDFDENDIIPESSDFDQADVITEPVEERRDEASDAFKQGTQALLGGATGAGLGVIAKKTAGAAADLAMSLPGHLDRDTINTLDKHRSKYPNVTPIETMMEEFRSLADRNRKYAFQRADDARQHLRGQKPVPVSDFYQTISKPTLDKSYSSELAPDKAQQLLEDELDKMYPTIEDKQVAAAKLNEKISNIETQLSSPYSNPKADIRQAVKDAKFQNKLDNIDPKLTTDAVNTETVDKAGDTFKDKKTSRQIQRIDENMREVKSKIGEQPKAIKQLEKIQKRKEDILYNQANAKERDNTTRDVRNTKQFEAAQNRKTQLELNKTVEDEAQVKLRAQIELEERQRLYQELKNLQDKKQHLIKQSDRVYNKAAVKADSSLEEIKRAPREIREVNPFLENRSLGDDYADALEHHIKDIRHSAELDPIRVDQKLKEIRRFVPQGKMHPDEKFNSELATEVKNYLQNRYPEYKEGMNDSARAINTEKYFKEVGIGVKKDIKDLLEDGTLGSDDVVNLEDSGKSKINKILLNTGTDKMNTERQYLRKALQGSVLNGDLLGNPDDLMEEAHISALKNKIDELKKGQKLSSFELTRASQGDLSAGVLAKLGGLGTKLQEYYALKKGAGWDDIKGASSELKNAVKGVVDAEDAINRTKALKGAVGAGTDLLANTAFAGTKALGKSLPFIGGALGAITAAQAAESGELSPVAATAAGIGEVVNPVPFTDVVEGAKAASQEVDEAIASHTPEELTAEPDFSGDLVDPAAQLTQQNPVVRSAISGFVKGTVSPIPEMTKGLVKNINEGGLERSNDARSRMEQQMKALDAFKPKEEKKPTHESFKEFVEQGPEHLANLAESFKADSSAQAFIAPLEKAANADDRTRTAVLFGLYQQPAFRAALKAKGN